MKYNWKLSSDNFSFLDRLKVAKFVLNNKNQLTMGPKVEEFEKKMEEFSNVKCLAVSSGSSANSIIFEVFKQRNLNLDIKNDVLVICPAVTWISSITCATMAGFTIDFCDINLNDFCFDYDKLEEMLENNKNKKCIIWPTALIGYTPHIGRLSDLAKKYNCELFADCAENLLGNYKGRPIMSHFEMASTSCYFAHEICSVEGGFVYFQNDDINYEYAKMIRNHGMIRSLESDNLNRLLSILQNPTIDPQFLFEIEGTNYRMSDLHAMFGLLDLQRIHKYKFHRKEIFNYYRRQLDADRYYLPKDNITQEHIAFCLPIFINRQMTTRLMKNLKEELNKNGIETRPIIGSNLTVQPVFQNEKFAHINKNVPNAKWVHEHGCYVGLSQKTSKKDIDRLVGILNNF